MEKEKIVEMSCPECEEGTARREKTLFKRRIGKEIFVIPEVEHLVCDKCGYEFIEKHLKLRNGEEVELYVNNDEIVILPKGVRV